MYKKLFWNTEGEASNNKVKNNNKREMEKISRNVERHETPV